MDETRNDDTLSERPTLGRAVTEKMDSEGPFLPWTDEDAERETMKHPDSPEEMTLAGRYKVLRRLGEGGMGSVWLAEDLKLDGRKVAIKMLPAVLAGKKTAYKQVKQEALMAMKLSHPNIATVRAFEEEDGNPFLVMDYIEGQGLDDILAEKGKLSEEETLRLLTPVAAALDYAHAQGVVHRDVKPGNIIVRKDGTPFVLDFGIAREIQETMTRVTGKFSSGTLLYMSPEQLRSRAPKAAQDVYSFAVVAYECLTGRPPFYRGAVEDQIKNELPEALEESVASKDLRDGIMEGLAKEPERRPGSCTEVLELGEAVKRAREAGEARRRRQEVRFAQEWARAEYEKRREEQALKTGRAARKLAEAKTEKAREEAKKQAMEAFQAQEAQGRMSRWAGFLVFVLIVAGVAGVAGAVWWKGEKLAEEQMAAGTALELPPPPEAPDEAPVEVEVPTPPPPVAEPLPVSSGGDANALLAKARERKSVGDAAGARESGLEALAARPGNPEIEAFLSKLDMDLLFSSSPMPEKVEYTIQPGDFLAKIAATFNTPTLLLAKSNGVRGNNIHVGQKLVILDGRNHIFAVRVSKSRNDLLLTLDGKFFKRYRVSTGSNAGTPTGVFKIVDKIEHPTWFPTGGRAIPYGDPKNLLGTHWLALDRPGYGLHGTWEPESIGRQSRAGCVQLLNEEIEELYTILPKGTVVTIVE